MADPLDHKMMAESSPRSVPALISYLSIILFAYVATWVFCLVVFRIAVEPAMLTVLGGIVTAATAALGAVLAYWLAASINANKSNAAKDAIIAQQAGAGPPPPAPADPVAEAT